MAATVLVTAGWAFVLLNRSNEFLPWLGAPCARRRVHRCLRDRHRQLPSATGRGAIAIAAVVVGLAGPTAYAVQTSVSAHSGSIPTAGPTVAGAMGGPGGMRGPGGAGGPGGWQGRWPRHDAANRHSRLHGNAAAGIGSNADNSRSHRHNTGRHRWPWWWTWWIAEQHHTECCADSHVAAGFSQLHLGRRGDRIAERIGIPTRHRRPGDANRRDSTEVIHRQRSTSSNNLLPKGKIHYFIGGQAGGPGGQSGSSSQISAWCSRTSLHKPLTDDAVRPLRRPTVNSGATVAAPWQQLRRCHH